MSSLSVYHHQQPQQPEKILNHVEDITRVLADLQIHFAQHDPKGWPGVEADPRDWQALLGELCGTAVAELPLQWCCASRQAPLEAAQREREAAEQVAEQPRICLVVGGRMLCLLQVGERLYAVRAQRGDLLVIPPGVPHGFDFGEEPHVTLLRQAVPLQSSDAPFYVWAAGFAGLDD